MIEVLHVDNGGDTSSSNTWTADGSSYFEETGRERDDGACTGSVYRILGDGRCRKVGSYRVDGEGVKRWPTATAEQRKRAWALACARTVRHPPLHAIAHNHADMHGRCLGEDADGIERCAYEPK